jgi:c(7)-type cytochrome triheme protein
LLCPQKLRMPPKVNIIIRLATTCIGICAMNASLALQPVTLSAPQWFPLERDDLHDPQIAELGLLHNPETTLSLLPGDNAGNHVNWVQALERGFIRPYTGLKSEHKLEVLDSNVIWPNSGEGELGLVVFPHKQHTEWMACTECHEGIFKSKAGSNKFSMLDILNGEYCGRCHGAIAFPPTECKRCHSVARPPVVLPAGPH